MYKPYILYQKKTIYLLIYFFNYNKESSHVLLLHTVAHHLCNKHNNVFKNYEIKNNNVITLHLNENNIATMLLCTNKVYTFGRSVNNVE